ncbi:family 78 glycoside hydrolase catalytic domain [Vagococcus sp. BWB3-3]|uniref:alpha-L-rhamnosidase n=1 Tax=Vagococcus allomyrinae TaxID=2794353 RepID=A0A940P2J2_9ENTE|nr:alpha-L-rhamnosidase [Vagococcus allomyrinae]MBP1040282.1 family 78 glycoside hydrolase catalytic domain [Vagococcus allomyrinae]
MIQIKQIKLNYEKELIGIESHPQISWSLLSDKRGCMQQQYWIQFSTIENFKEILYSTSWVVTDQASGIQFSDSEFELESGKRYFIRVKIITNDNEESDWSVPTSFVTGIVHPSEWSSDFISSETHGDRDSSKGTLLRGVLRIEKEVVEAYAFLTAQGLYKAYLNGEKIGDDELTPGWTSYNKRLLYQTYDITNTLKKGVNIFGAVIGAGWYKGKMGFLDERNNYGDQTSFLGQLLIRFRDGTSMTWGTSEDFLCHDGPIIFSEIYDGEIYDAQLERTEWLNNQSLEAYRHWRKVEKKAVRKESLVSQPTNRPCINERLAVKQKLLTPEKDVVLDFGQNLTGWVEFEVTAAVGSRVVLECFEVLDKDGNVYQDNLRTAKQKIVYICKGEGKEVFHPSFTFQGFRYVKITEYPGELIVDHFRALVVHSNLEFTGDFECSNQQLNQLQHNITWSLKGNFVDIPMDCPQRNERVGWTGDAQIFCRTANFIVNAYGFYNKWLQDVAADQLPEGGIPHVVPDILTGHPKVGNDWLLSQGTHSAAAWADVAVIAPWNLYINFGDKKILEQQFVSMKKWIDFMANNSVDYIWNYKLQFGDWVALDAEEGSYFGATPNELTCTAYFAYSTKLFVKVCKLLNKENLIEKYQDLYNNIVATYQQLFFTSAGSLKVKTQTAHIITLAFDLIKDEWKPQVAAELIKLLNEQEGHLVTGFVGTPYFCHVLSDHGYVDEAYELLLKEDFPSWLYQINQGATTIWEHWDGIREDGSMWSPDMNSFNHYAYGAVGEWMYRKILGIELDEHDPGYKRVKIEPLVNKHLDYARGSYESIYGEIATSWEFLKDNTIQLQVRIPVNTSAKVCLKNCDSILDSDDISFQKVENGYEGDVLAGNYSFTYQLS